MIRRREDRLQGEVSGFTLIEILTVIIIIGVLSGVLLPVLVTARTRGRAAATKADISAIEVACEAFKADFGQYPPDQHYAANGVANVTALLGIIQPESYYNLPGNAKDLITDPENGTTKGLVHMLGSEFGLQGKVSGPYIRFKQSRLKSPAGTGDPGRGARFQYSGYGLVGGTYVRITGVGAPYGNTYSGVGIFPVLVLMDWFGNNYVYDSHFPENRELLPQPHNQTSFDIFSFGPQFTRGSNGLVSDYTDDWTSVGEAEDDINNWK